VPATRVPLHADVSRATNERGPTRPRWRAREAAHRAGLPARAGLGRPGRPRPGGRRPVPAAPLGARPAGATVR